MGTLTGGAKTFIYVPPSVSLELEKLYICPKVIQLHLLEYWIYTSALDDLPALIIRIFEIGGLWYLLVIFKVILEE